MTRLRTLLLVVLALGATAATAAAQQPAPRFVGTTQAHGAVSFTVRSGTVVGFHFVNRCPSESPAGNAVPTMTIRRGRFSYRDEQFTVSGRIRGRTASGTARNSAGDCDSGRLTWHARRR